MNYFLTYIVKKDRIKCKIAGNNFVLKFHYLGGVTVEPDPKYFQKKIKYYFHSYCCGFMKGPINYETIRLIKRKKIC